MRSLERLIDDGAVVVGPKPIRSTSLKNYPHCDQEVQEIANRIWGDCDGQQIRTHNFGQGRVYWGMTLAEVLNEMGIPPDFEVRGIENEDQHIDYIHRQTESEDIYFVTNSAESPEQFGAVFRVDGTRKPEIWDPETGSINPHVEYRVVEGRIIIDMELDPLESCFVVFSDHPKARRNRLESNDQEHTIDLSADWAVQFDTLWGGPDRYKMSQLVSWTDVPDDRVRYYSGKAIYHKTITLDEEVLQSDRVTIDFEYIQEMARVWINNQNCGIIWTPPYDLEITKALQEGENEIRVEVINTWNNRIVGDIRNPEQRQYTRTNIKYKFRQGQLLESGLTGRVMIRY